MRKLTNKDIARIVKQWLKGKPITKIAEFFQVTRQRIHQIINKFKETRKIPFLQKLGRKPKQIDEETERIILEAHGEFNLGPVHLERKIEEIYGEHIPHNTIHKVLLNHGLVEENMEKKKQRKWVRYEREHSMSLWQGDWKMIHLNGEEKWMIAFMDDASRIITCFGVFDSATTENTIKVLKEGFAEYGIPDEILTDHGTQFVPSRKRDEAKHKFKQFLAEHRIKHVVARIKHPQTNGKIERFFGEVERRVGKFGSVEAVVRWHNEIKPHRSLDWDEPCNVFRYKLPPERVMWFVRWWDEKV
ncbi:MAG: transposase [Archaeoglobus sp.]|nr:transposase [Archaeoglobus sp.]